MIGFTIALLILLVLLRHWRATYQAHEARLQRLPIRIHVNGIRGKSTVTRLVAGVLREGGYNTVAKTTGSAARIIFADGNEAPIQRKGAATIVEQIDIIRDHVGPQTEALVIECMAVHPLYQRVSQDQIVKGTITIITNVREDHQDVMGESLEEIADSLSNTIPYKGLLITGEDRPYLRDQLRRNTQARRSDFLYADPAAVTDEDMAGFNYLSFKENIACGLALAEMLGIPRDVALRGMQKSIPDIGVVFVQRVMIQGKEVVWAPLFAVNDRESTLIGMEALRPYYEPGATRIGILNNRYDRAMRAIQFAEIAARDLDFDYLITFGAYEEQVTQTLIDHGFPRERVLNLGFSINPTLEEILDTVVEVTRGEQVLLVAMVNIHTPQAELLMEFFHHLEEEQEEGGALTFDLGHIPESAQRRRYLISHLLKLRT